jgi:hypothetical protein
METYKITEEEIKGNLEWFETNIPAIVKVENKTAYSFMPSEMVEYIKSLPEFNKKIWKKNNRIICKIMKILKAETYREFVCEVAKAIDTGKDKDVVFIENFPFGVQKKHEFVNGDVNVYSRYPFEKWVEISNADVLDDIHEEISELSMQPEKEYEPELYF